MTISQFLNQKESLKIPKLLIQAVGLDAAVMLMNLVQDYDYWEKNQRAEEGWIYPTSREMAQRSQFSSMKQHKLLEKLKSLGLISIENYGEAKRSRPAKRYIKVNEDALRNIFIWEEE